MRVLVTGINGFVGRHLLHELESHDVDVWGLDTTSSSDKTMAADILNQDMLKNIINEITPDFVIHLAAISSVDHKDLSAIYRVNFNGTLNLLSACIAPDKMPKFLFVSSSQVYGNVAADKLPIDESFPLEPVNHYGASKAAAEMAVKAFGAEHGLPFVIARPFNHTGPGQSDRFVVAKIVNAFRQRNTSIELGNVDTVRDFVDVRDVVKAYMAVLENFKTGEVFNISCGHGISVSDIFDKLKYLTGHDMKIVNKDFLVRRNEIQYVIGNSEKIRREIGWKPEILFEKMLEDILTN